ncbi:hypothetical protein BX070DRAFT_12014 [Coemansia spiralis]|nr:hypothetical protein BX070DRAFT_12014 [Coemansia spiralis]
MQRGKHLFPNRSACLLPIEANSAFFFELLFAFFHFHTQLLFCSTLLCAAFLAYFLCFYSLQLFRYQGVGGTSQIYTPRAGLVCIAKGFGIYRSFRLIQHAIVDSV